jgi:Mg/Co/Ni transporter MgtE
MATVEYRRIETLLKDAAYAELEELVSQAELAGLAELWAQFGAMSKLVLFKLLDADRALKFYALLPMKEKYYLLCGFPMQSIAPVLETLKPAERRVFVSLPREFYDRMFRGLVSERVEITFPLNPN